MTLHDQSDGSLAYLEDFRHETRAWLAENCPISMRQSVRGDEDLCWGGRDFVFQSRDQQLWLERMAERGWTAPTWPKAYGGGGLTKEEAAVLAQEMQSIKARAPLTSFGVWMLGPALLKFGSEAQKKTHLPSIVQGKIRWCQGYSEPGAGSDLASLATKAELHGDHYHVTGQKIWTSYADQSDWIFCLVRTDPSAPKHRGISFLLFDMASKGVTTKPILLISGASPFCETFFDDVRVPKDNLVGQAGEGWTIAKYLLTHERTMISDMGATKPVYPDACRVLGLEEGELADSMLRAEVAQHDMDAAAFKLTVERFASEAEGGIGLGARSSLLKYYGAELNKRRHELLVKIEGAKGLEWEGQGSDNGALIRGLLRSRGNSIEGGTSEIQLNIIAKHLLGLPGA